MFLIAYILLWLEVADNLGHVIAGFCVQALMGAFSVATLAALQPAVSEMERAAAKMGDAAPLEADQRAFQDGSPSKHRKAANIVSCTGGELMDDQQSGRLADESLRARDTMGRSDSEQMAGELHSSSNHALREHVRYICCCL